MDSSTLAFLEPNLAMSFLFNAFKVGDRFQGSFITPLRKPSREAEAARKYVRGDPVKLIDWRAFARTDELMVREFRPEVTASVGLFIQANDTMRWPNQKTWADLNIPSQYSSRYPTKFEIAARMAFHIAHAHIRGGDHTEIIFCDEDNGEPLRARYSPNSSHNLLAVFEELKSYKFGVSSLLSAEGDLGKLKWSVKTDSTKYNFDVSYWIGDGLALADPANSPGSPDSHDINNLRRFLKEQRRGILFHVLSHFELTSNWMKNDVCYFDHGVKRKDFLGDALQKNDNYLRQLNRWKAALQNDIEKEGGQYFLVNERTAISQYMQCLELMMRA